MALPSSAKYLSLLLLLLLLFSASFSFSVSSSFSLLPAYKWQPFLHLGTFFSPGDQEEDQELGQKEKGKGEQGG